MTVEIDGVTFAQVDALKHDSWGATALYIGPAGKVICKFNRKQSIFGLPMAWLGRRLARREARILALVHDVPHLPRACGHVMANGVVQHNAVAHWYVEGHPLGEDEWVRDDFFPRLQATLSEMHRRGIAYIDLHKRENIIVADDGSPCLIDFQVCWGPGGSTGWLRRVWPFSMMFRAWQKIDHYHLLKHILRVRPDLVPPEQRDINRMRPWTIRMSRLITDRTRNARRRILVWIGVRTKEGGARSEVAPEDAYRSPPPAQ